IYPKETDFIALNTYAPAITPGTTHSHIGEMEISLIAENIIKNPLKWESEALNAFRYEMCVLLIEKLSKGKAPPALVESVGNYLLDPIDVVAPLLSGANELSQMDGSIEELWGKSNIDQSPTEMIYSLSIIALLVEKFGWQKVLTFLQTIPTTTNVASAFEATFNMSLDDDFKELWLSYYPFYVQDRWQYHFLYNIDEDSYRLLIQSGAYADAKSRLEEHIRILQNLGEEQNVLKLRELLEIATMGQEGLSLLRQARQGYIAGNTAASLEQLVQAEAIFREINDDQRLAESNALKETMAQAQNLAMELEHEKWIAFLFMSPNRAKHLDQLISKLIRIGNQQNTAQLQAFIDMMKVRSIVFAILALVLLSFFSYRRLRAWVKKLDQEPYL
ncbi:MAG: hypothetical protein D6735_13300, partial [Acidobacteria bacterium]